MATAFVLGNGPTRLALDATLLKGQGTVFGCNAIWRDWSAGRVKPDYIVAIDKAMIAELRSSPYPQHRIIIPVRDEHWEPVDLHPTREGHPPRSNAGVNALREALRRDFTTVYLIGFDFLIRDPATAVGNIYDGTPCYGPETRAKAEESKARAAYLDWVIKNMGQEARIMLVFPQKHTNDLIKLKSPQVRVITTSALEANLKVKL